MKLHFQVRGDQSNPAILFLHGFLGLGEDWLEIAQDLSRDHFCILPDLPGHGQSRELSDHQSFDMAATSEAIINLLDDLKIDRVTLLGLLDGWTHRLVLCPPLCAPSEIIGAGKRESGN